LGTFSVRKYDAYIGRNLRTDKSAAVGEKQRIHFRIARQLHDRLQTQIKADAQRERR
jgi:nucleoid DNA-binding protein